MYGDEHVAELGGPAVASRMMAWEMGSAKKVSELGLGPDVYGMVLLPDGRFALAMEIVHDAHLYEHTEAHERMNSRTVSELRTAFDALERAGYAPVPDGDMEYLVVSNGGVRVIDTVLQPLSKCDHMCGVLRDEFVRYAQRFARPQRRELMTASRYRDASSQ